MNKKKNFLKRNSGFIVGCVLAGGASFVTANFLTSDMVSGFRAGEGQEEPQSDNIAGGTIDPESPARTAFETDPFTVTASGSVVNGVESEALQSETTQPVTEENQELPEGAYSENDAGYVGSGSDGSGESSDQWSSSGDSYSGGDGYYDDGSYSGDSGYYDDGSYSGDSGYYDDGSYSGGDGGYYDDGSSGQQIEIYDSGNGSYTYNDGSDGSGTDGSGGSGDSGTDSAWTPSEVIIQGISSRYIDVSELYNYDLDQLRLIRNEIFALHGRIFTSDDLREYFSQRSWYVPTYDPDEFDENMFDYLNDYEEANLQVILDYEAQLGGY